MSNSITNAKTRQNIIKLSLGAVFDNTKMIEPAEEAVLEVFTPEAHSPNEVSIEEKAEETSQSIEIIEKYDRNKEFTTMVDINSCTLEQITVPKSTLEQLITEYSQNLPKEYDEFTLKGSDLLYEIEDYKNTIFYWIISENKICGLFVHSEYTYGYIITHISLLDYSQFPLLLLKIPEFLKDQASNIIIKFPVFFEDSLSENIKNSLFQIHFKIQKKQPIQFIFEAENPTTRVLIKIDSYSIIQISEAQVLATKKGKCDEMIEIGTKNCLLSSLVTLFKTKNIEKNDCNRLQEDLDELIEILFYSNFSKYPHISTYSNLNFAEIPKILTETPFFNSNNSKFSISTFNLNIDITDCSYIQHKIDEIYYKFIEFSNKTIELSIGEDDSRMFCMQTMNKSILFFVLEFPDMEKSLQETLKFVGTDLFYNISEIIKSFSNPVKCKKKLLVPCFKKKKSSELP